MNQTKTTFIQEIRSLPGPVWTLSAGIFVDRFGTFVFPFLILFLTANGAGKELAGVAAGLMGVGGLIAAGVGGFLADRIGRRNTIAVSMFGSAIGGLLLYGASVYAAELGGYWACFVCAVTYGLVRGVYFPASSSLIADVVPNERRVAAFAILRFAINLGWALGMTAAGFLAEISFLILFLIDAFTSLVYGVVALRFLPHGLRTEKSESGWGPALKSIRGNPRFLLVFVNSLFIAIIYTQWSSSYAVFLRDYRDLEHPERFYGIMMAINGFLIAALELPISAVVRRFSAPAMIALGSAVASIGFGMNAWEGGATGLVVAVVVFTLGEMIAMPVQGAYVSELAPERMRGRYNGAMGLTWSSANTVAPLLGLWLLGYGPSVLWAAMTSLGGLSAMILLVRAGRGKLNPDIS